jgi:hypothetical protein
MKLPPLPTYNYGRDTFVEQSMGGFLAEVNRRPPKHSSRMSGRFPRSEHYDVWEIAGLLA